MLGEIILINIHEVRDTPHDIYIGLLDSNVCTCSIIRFFYNSRKIIILRV